jgi:signal transduction histidine kinase/CheY-like chemotaxis protein
MAAERARPPSRAVSLGVSAALVAVWGVARLGAPTSILPLTYALPLLVCVWTRDRLALWGMAAIFAAFHTVKLFWLFPDDVLSRAELWANYGATLVNISVAAVAIQLVILMRERLQRALDSVQEQSDELAQQNEELAAQGEELSQQTEELSQQGEELASQNEELQTQAEEIGTLMEAVSRRGALLNALLDTARSSGTERSALDQIAVAACDLFAGIGARIAVYERLPNGGLGMRALALPGRSAPEPAREDAATTDDLVALALGQGRTASLDDLGLRPDLSLAVFEDLPPLRAALAAPIRIDGKGFGALAVYCTQVHPWSDEEYRLAEWLADQCGRALQTLRIQSALREADRHKTVFLATLSHELRNPLGAIRFALEAIETSDGHDGNAVSILRRQFRQLVRLVDDLLDATRLSSNRIQIRKTRTDLVPIVQHTIEACRPEVEAARLKIDVSMPQQAIWLDADPERIAQVVTNLVSNSIRYTPAGGRIGVRIEGTDREAVLSVADSGIGLENGDLERVFGMFTQTGEPGSGGLGIGLALVRGIVERHGGRVEAHSEGPGTGSSFRVTLPIASSSASDAVSGAAPVPTPAASRVLVVDDNVDSATSLGALLEVHGHQVCVVHDAEAALAVIDEFAPDAALLDIGLPGIDGYELARRLRGDQRSRPIRLVALTGWGQEADRARAEAAGFDEHLTKPAEPDRVLAALRGA